MRNTKASIITGVIAGGVTGSLIRLIVGFPRFFAATPAYVSFLMTLAFLLLGPIAVGCVTVRVAESAVPRKIWQWILLPWPAILLSCGIVALLNIEGSICIVFALPLAMIFSSVGGLIAGAIARNNRGKLPVVCVVLLPLIFAPLESRLTPPVEHRTVATQILIHSSASTVWHNIESVRPIATSELPTTWAHTIGFPRPVEATLSYEGVGGVRHASFEHGLMFIETVTRWEPDSRLAFSIVADTKNIPPTTLDEHVTIGGHYFDVLDGEYRIEPLQGGAVLLHLSSRERLSTDFNGYAGLWSDAVMTNLQRSILVVIKKRCEATAP